MPRRFSYFLLRFLRCTAGVLSVLGYLTASIGFPLIAPAGPTQVSPEIKTAKTVRPCGCVEDSCGSKCCCCGDSAGEEQPGPPDDTVHFLSGQLVRKCHGLDSLWSVLAAAIPLAPATRCQRDESPAGLVGQTHFSNDVTSTPPPSPPPRG
jgi:hypothetical protein